MLRHQFAPKTSSEGEDADAPRALSRNLVKVLSAVVIAASLLSGVVLRVARLDTMPPALGQDEACDGYDAYSILTTGRDHHGNFLPIVMQGFNDYRMPLFQYSLVPLVGLFGLKSAVVRLGAALWGVADLIAITIVAGLMLGWPGAAAAALLGALMPWHLEISRYGIETSAASATISLAIAFFFLWLYRRRDLWLLLSGVSFGLSLYTYAISKALLPLLIGLLAILYWRELRQSWVKALTAMAIVFALALPQAVMTIRYSTEMQAEYRNLSLLSADTICPGCDSTQTKLAVDSIPYLLVANFASNFTPSFLFLTGDRGNHWTMLHPPNFGELLPEQAILVVLGLLALFNTRRRKIAILVLGWLMFAAVPATLIKPLGAQFPEPGNTPTPHILVDYYSLPRTPITPSLLLRHPDSRHDVLAMAPWILLSALGFVVLIDLTLETPVLQAGAVCLLAAGVMFHSARFLRSYFEDFPSFAAPYFQYGIKEAIQAIDQRYSRDLPVVISPKINQPYIYVLFFQRYPAAAYQKNPVMQRPGLFGDVSHFDRYYFVSPRWAYPWLAHGILVFRGSDKTPAPPDLSIHYPDGSVAYQIVVK
jgi:4-amino-4-deoxy-L-arabinose transferase-like glycosyltransferase